MKIRSIALAVSLVLAPTLLAADFGIRAGRYSEAEETFVGAEVVIDAGVLNVNPNIEYSLEEDVTAGSANLDVTIDLGRFAAITPYLGAGIGLLYADDDIGGEETDAVGNLIGGLQFNLATLKPYAQVKYFRLLEDDDGDTDEIALTVGLRF
jgi:opacity protein-like surface antigen